MNTTEISRTVVEAYIEALGSGRIDDAKAMFAEDATWTLGGDLPMSGTWHGRKGIFEDFLGLAFGRLDASTVALSTTNLVAAGDTVVVEWTSDATARDGSHYHQQCAGIFIVKDGLISAVREYFDTDHARRVLFAA
ncbi:hypothetical protein EDD99_4095 [Streptomyces sp. 846.5]|nr:nuclear transport factor 2 family protein [Streptomyces sp. 846.5]TDU05570.1 hypothetical protein EDD99_4095 [Streptomyces sp. 846.5]